MARLLAEEDKAALIEVLLERYGGYLDAERFIVDGRVEPGFVEATILLERLDGTRRYEMVFYVSLTDNKISEAEGRDLALDFAGYYLDLFFNSGREILLPLDFHEYEFGEFKVFARGDVTNPLLDALADEIIEKGETIPPDDPRLLAAIGRSSKGKPQS